MGYSTLNDVTIALANALSQGNPVNSVGTTLPITSVGNSLTSAVQSPDLYQYIRWADDTIDSDLSSLYRTPLKRINLGSFPLYSNVTAGDSTIGVQEATRFNVGDVLLIRDTIHFQELTILSIANQSSISGTATITFTTTITNSYTASSTNIELIAYPPPINKISARLAAAYIFDKAYAAASDPNVSKYGEFLRTLAASDMNLILSGAIKLKVPGAYDLVGMRYQDASLSDLNTTRAEPKEYIKSM